MALMAIPNKVEFDPITPGLGAVVPDLDTRLPLAPAEVADLTDLLMRYKVLFFPRQGLDEAEHARFAAQFGVPRDDPLEDPVPGFHGLSELDNVPFFHADWMFQTDPPKWAMLQLWTVPPVGGDTVFVDLVASYAALSAPMRALLEPLTVLHAMDPDHAAGLRQRVVDRLGSDHPEIPLAIDHLQPRAQPLVRRIPETGDLNHWLCPAYSRRLNELGPTESDAVLGFLFRHILEPQFSIRWRWQAGDIAFWDHRTTLHRGIKDYGGAVRHGRRASIAGGAVVPATAP
ncbi:MAG: TauD/TfdA dioxygenase family protein [Acidimicrobiales bacterium]